jgi:hypothetical protein
LNEKNEKSTRFEEENGKLLQKVMELEELNAEKKKNE